MICLAAVKLCADFGKGRCMNKEIGVSYASQNLEKVNSFDSQMFSLGIQLKRYDTCLKANDDIFAFMESMKTLDHVLVMMSSEYLKSPFCFFELTNLLSAPEKIILIYLETDHQIQCMLETAQAYWRGHREKTVPWLEEQLEKIDPDGIFQQLSQLLKHRYIPFDYIFTARGKKELLELLQYTPDQYIDELKKILEIDDFYQRELAFSDYLGHAPANEIFNHYKALSYEAQKYIEGAAFFLHQAISINPSYIAPYMKLFDLSFQYPNQILIESTLISQIESMPGLISADRILIHKVKGMLLFNQAKSALEGSDRTKLLHQALEQFQVADELSQGNDATVYNNMGQIYEQMENLPAALDSYTKAVEKSPEYFIALNNLALFFDKYLGKISEARKIYERCLAIKPDYIIAQSNYALLMEKIDVRQALEQYFQILCAAKGHRDYITNLALILEEENISKDLAGILYRIVLKENPQSISGQFNMGNFMRRQGAPFDEVLEYLNPVMRALPHNDMVHLTMSLLYYREGRISDAQEYCGKALRENPIYIPAIFFQNYLKRFCGAELRTVINEVEDEIKRIKNEWKEADESEFALLYHMLAVFYKEDGDEFSSARWYELTCQCDGRFQGADLTSVLKRGILVLEHDYPQKSKGRIYKHRKINLSLNDSAQMLAHLKSILNIVD